MAGLNHRAEPVKQHKVWLGDIIAGINTEYLEVETENGCLLASCCKMMSGIYSLSVRFEIGYLPICLLEIHSMFRVKSLCCEHGVTCTRAPTTELTSIRHVHEPVKRHETSELVSIVG